MRVEISYDYQACTHALDAFALAEGLRGHDIHRDGHRLRKLGGAPQGCQVAEANALAHFDNYYLIGILGRRHTINRLLLNFA